MASSFSQITKLSDQKLNKSIVLYIWVNRIRKLGNLLFLIGQDSSGYLQIIVKEKKLIDNLKNINRGDLLKIKGVIKKKTGTQKEIEIELKKYQSINPSKELPFEIKDDVSINEDTRYRYRYLDLRRPKSKNLLLIKNQFLHEIRNFLHKKGFIEVETPILSQNSPEGAKCFLVPSNFNNRYYTLPQSPQIFKQLLMVGGLDRYYQIAKSFRNEDARSNRQIEFSQLDLEMTLASSRQIMRIIENLLQTVLKKVLGYQVKTPFLRLTYQQAITKYGNDKPDLRTDSKKNQLNFVWVTDWPLFEYDQETLTKWKS
jgi:aspartyl-tRNA synthetase